VVRRIRIWLVFLAVSLAGCGNEPQPVYELTGPVMGTTFSVKVVNPPAGTRLDETRDIIVGRLEEIEQRTSTYRPGSELSKLNANLTTDWIETSPELCDLVDRAIALSRFTNGAFDVTVGPLVLLWGFGPDGAREAPPGSAMIAEARGSVGYDKLEADCGRPAVRKALPGVSIDLSAFAKGYAVDEVSALLDRLGLKHFLVEVGGELYARGFNGAGDPWAIAIEKPDTGTRDIQTIVNVTDLGTATSGDYRNYFEHDGIRYSHTIDPETGRPVTHDTAAVTVIDDSTADADALATAFLVMGDERGMILAEKADIAAFFLLRTDDGVKERTSPAFDAMVTR
jgi:thiamine biosynthesis lipoprotein